ncbi:TetR/AcrR family transcriptional regulator [Methanococcus maripaludis]|uniref:AcrR family transcriptional regulator n=1 Tax=Methanococcus maripaludis TaxID=39152 RepID=A0A2L1CCX3_METMI|nr:TetR/AcrR family transcriptional regulator [Methanococcus maripaludis]AVB77201.1 HTH-type transcriptional regulator AcrR [Methanococcus maripaludis]MBA2863711.1 AcrR family transcriptional regulator [Methanococcus maripaludis]MBB6496283.1 AcrR family transcriptional regulator [Methanococcus maripaludis]
MSTKEKIVQNAAKLFLTKGYKQTSLNEIAEKTGITKGGIYHHFKDKNELFVEMAEYFKSKFASLLTKMEQESSLEDLLKNYFENSEILMQEIAEYLELTLKDIKHFSEFQSRFTLDAIQYGPKDMDFTMHTKSMYSLLKKKIELAKKNGEILEEIDSKEISLEIIAIIEGYSNLRRLKLMDDSYEYGNKCFERLWNRIKK